jgi:HD-like signal output (HDOD) protein
MTPLCPTVPPRELSGWTCWFSSAEIPVLAETADAIRLARANEDLVDAHSLAGLINQDPLMTLKVLVHVAGHPPRRLQTETETVTAALVLMGITPFFEAFDKLPTVEQALASHPEAREGLREVRRRSHRAANFVLGFAVHRMDPDAHAVQHAALLHDTAEMLLWCHAPQLACQIREAQRRDPALRSVTVQRQLLNVELPDLQRELMKKWSLPEVLCQLTKARDPAHPASRSVGLAVRLARHTAHGWDNPAVPDDLSDVAEFLNLSWDASLQLLTELDH